MPGKQGTSQGTLGHKNLVESTSCCHVFQSSIPRCNVLGWLKPLDLKWSHRTCGSMARRVSKEHGPLHGAPIDTEPAGRLQSTEKVYRFLCRTFVISFDVHLEPPSRKWDLSPKIFGVAEAKLFVRIEMLVVEIGRCLIEASHSKATINI